MFKLIILIKKYEVNALINYYPFSTIWPLDDKNIEITELKIVRIRIIKLKQLNHEIYSLDFWLVK